MKWQFYDRDVHVLFDFLVAYLCVLVELAFRPNYITFCSLDKNRSTQLALSYLDLILFEDKTHGHKPLLLLDLIIHKFSG